MTWRQLLANLEIAVRVDGLIDEQADITAAVGYLAEFGLLGELQVIVTDHVLRPQPTSSN